jgi:hypothetical protein
MKKRTLIFLFLLISPPKLWSPTPQGLLQSGFPAAYRKTKYDRFLVFTPQSEHTFEASKSMLKFEIEGKIYWHILCKTCQTYLVAGECSYTPIDLEEESSTDEEGKD